MAASDESQSTWQTSVQDWGSTVLQGGVDILKAQADAKAKEQNQPVKPSDSATGGLPKYAVWIAVGLLGLLTLLVVMRRR